MRIRSVLGVFFLVVTSTGWLPVAAEAVPVTFNFTGRVTSVYDPFHFVGSSIEPGDRGICARLILRH